MTYQKDLVSIIMPCYNNSETISESIESVLSQTYKNFELIVVNDGSTDNVIAVLGNYQNHPNLKIFSQENQGAGPARNLGLSHAQGEYIAFLDADDLWKAEFLQLMHGKIIATGTDMVYCGWQNTGLSEQQSKPFIPPDYSDVDRCELLLAGNRWPIHVALVKHDVIRRAGGFDEQWTSCMDYDLWLRTAPFHSLALVPKVLAYYRFHGGEQITKNRSRIAINHWRVQENFLRKHPEVIRKYGRKRIKDITVGELLRRGFIAYWAGDLVAARKIFRVIMWKRYGTQKDWKYLLPALLPLSAHRWLIAKVGKP